jgi:hypothetical protein
MQIIWGAHLIPAFAHDRTNELLGPSAVRQHRHIQDWKPRNVGSFADGSDMHGVSEDSEPRLEDDDQEFDEDEDWRFFYVNM